MATSSVAELKDALRATLDRNGALNDVRAKLRQEIFKALNETNIIPKPDLPNETLVINELIREYLIYQGYRETLSVFLPEANQPVMRPFDRAFLSEPENLKYKIRLSNKQCYWRPEDVTPRQAKEQAMDAKTGQGVPSPGPLAWVAALEKQLDGGQDAKVLWYREPYNLANRKDKLLASD